MTDHPNAAPRRSSPPLWLVEGLDIVRQRRAIVLTVAVITVVIGALFALFAPAVVPPTPVVGAAVGVVALLLGMAGAVASDATDLRLRGPRHVSAAGGELVAVLPTEASVDAVAGLAEAVLDARGGENAMLLGLAASGRSAQRTAEWTDVLGQALVTHDVSVLYIDLASGRSESPGLVEVVRDGVKLTTAVTFEPGARLARLGAGADHVGALESLSTLPSRLPRDLDVLLVSLPTAASRNVVDAVRSLDHVLVVAERDETARVDLIAGLDALESAGTRAQVALLDDPTAAKLSVRGAVDVEVSDETDRDDQAAADATADGAGDEQPVADEPVADESVVDEPVVGEPVGDELVGDELVGDEPVDDEMVGDEPANDAPVGQDAPVEEPAAFEATAAVGQVAAAEAAAADADAAGRADEADAGEGAGAADHPADVVGADEGADDADDADDAYGADNADDAEGVDGAAGDAGNADNVRLLDPGFTRQRDPEPNVAAEGEVVRRREVQVLLGAAEAQAAALTLADDADEATAETSADDTSADETSADDTSADETSADVPTAASSAVDTGADVPTAASSAVDTSAKQTAAEPAAEPIAEAEADDDDSTDELPRNTKPVAESDDQREDLLSTTARLSLLMDNIEQRDD